MSPYSHVCHGSSHSTHHLFAIYALGAPPELIKEAYQTHKDYLKPAFESPVPITDDNFLDHLADHEYVAVRDLYMSLAHVLLAGITTRT